MPKQNLSFNAPPRNFNIPLVHKTYELYKLFHGFIKLFPKSEKYTIGQKIENIILEIIELLLKTVSSSKAEKITLLKHVDAKTHLLKTFIRLAFETKSLDNKKYLILQESLQEIGKMIGGWLRYLKRKN